MATVAPVDDPVDLADEVWLWRSLKARPGYQPRPPRDRGAAPDRPPRYYLPVPFREQEVREICSQPSCDAWADNNCLRCSRPLCPDHAPRADRRCDRCEQDWDALVAARKPALRRSRRRLSTWTLPCLVAGAFVLGIFVSPYLVLAPVGVAIVVYVVFVARPGESYRDRDARELERGRCELEKDHRDQIRRVRIGLDELRREFLAERKHAELGTDPPD